MNLSKKAQIVLSYERTQLASCGTFNFSSHYWKLWSWLFGIHASKDELQLIEGKPIGADPFIFYKIKYLFEHFMNELKEYNKGNDIVIPEDKKFTYSFEIPEHMIPIYDTINAYNLMTTKLTQLRSLAVCANKKHQSESIRNLRERLTQSYQNLVEDVFKEVTKSVNKLAEEAYAEEMDNNQHLAMLYFTKFD
jgi:hypothetical protein